MAPNEDDQDQQAQKDRALWVTWTAKTACSRRYPDWRRYIVRSGANAGKSRLQRADNISIGIADDDVGRRLLRPCPTIKENAGDAPPADKADGL